MSDYNKSIRLAELKFEVKDSGSPDSSYLSLNEIKETIREITSTWGLMGMTSSSVDVDLRRHYLKNTKRIEIKISGYYLEDEHYKRVLYIAHPEALSNSQFSKIRDILVRDFVRRLKKSSIQKSSELKFDVEIIKRTSAMDTPHIKMKVLARVDKFLSLKEIKNVLSSLKKEYERNQKFRESSIRHRYDLFKKNKNKNKIDLGKFTFREEIEERDLKYATVVRILKPENLPYPLFEKLIKNMADVLR